MSPGCGGSTPAGRRTHHQTLAAPAATNSKPTQTTQRRRLVVPAEGGREVRATSQCPPSLATLRHSRARSPTVVTTRSRAPSLSKSAQASPRDTFNLPQKALLAGETSRNLPLPSLANSWFRSAYVSQKPRL